MQRGKDTTRHMSTSDITHKRTTSFQVNSRSAENSSTKNLPHFMTPGLSLLSHSEDPASRHLETEKSSGKMPASSNTQCERPEPHSISCYNSPNCNKNSTSKWSALVLCLQSKPLLRCVGRLLSKTADSGSNQILLWWSVAAPVQVWQTRRPRIKLEDLPQRSDVLADCHGPSHELSDVI